MCVMLRASWFGARSTGNGVMMGRSLARGRGLRGILSRIEVATTVVKDLVNDLYSQGARTHTTKQD